MPPDLNRIAEFEDAQGRPASIQEHSYNDQPALWIGKRGHRILLTQEQMRDLLPHFQRFAIEGKL